VSVWTESDESTSIIFTIFLI